MFLHQMEAIVSIIFQIFFATHAVMKIGEYHLDIPQFYLAHIHSHDVLRPITYKWNYLKDYNCSYTMMP